MAYVNEKNALHKLVSVAHGGTTLKGVIGGALRIIVERALRMADGHLTPYSRPVSMLNAEAIVRFLDHAGAILWTVAAANLVFNFTDGQGGSPSITVGKFLGGDIDHAFDFDVGGMVIQETFVLEDTTLTYTPTI